MNRNARITVRIPQSRKKILEQWAKDEDCTISDLINNLIENHLHKKKRYIRQAPTTKGEQK